MSTSPGRPSSQPGPVSRNVIFTIPRTSSHLLLQILNLAAQPAIHRHPSDGYFFTAPLIARFRYDVAGKPLPQWSAEAQNAVKDGLQRSYDGFAGFLREAEERGKGVVVKEHVNWMLDPVAESRFLHAAGKGVDGCHSQGAEGGRFTITPSRSSSSPSSSPSYRSLLNETALPDHVLLALRPTFLIRNPLLTFPSLLRTSIDNEGLEAVLAGAETQRWEMSFHWSRTLYEFYLSHSTRTNAENAPIILDADDILNPQLMSYYTHLLNLDPSLIRYSWPPFPEAEVESLSAVEKRMKDTLLGSRGIVKGKTAVGLTLEGEREKWTREFGEVLARRLEGFVSEAQGDYGWLFERRLTVGDDGEEGE